MKRNSLKIVCNPYTERISYYFKNEMSEWIVLSGSSVLSRQYYTKTSMKKRAREIIDKSNEIYNRKNKGLDIIFEGDKESFDYLKGTIEYYFGEQDITCEISTTKIVVVGKSCSGKSFLIEGMEKYRGYKYIMSDFGKYTVYSDECNHAQWYEIKGIDLGKEYVQKAYDTIEGLISNGLSSVVYCVNATTGRLENIEKDFLLGLIEKQPDLRVMVALTMCHKDDIKEVIDEIKKMTDQIKVIPILASEYKTNAKDLQTGENYIIKPFGLDDLSLFVFEGR